MNIERSMIGIHGLIPLIVEVSPGCACRHGADHLEIKPRDGKDSYDARRSRITRIMEQLAESSGNVEQLVAIKARDLSSGYRYLDVAETWARPRRVMTTSCPASAFSTSSESLDFAS